MVAEEMRHESASAEEELFLDSDMLISTINNAWEMIHGIDQGDPDIRERERDGTFTPYGVIQQHQEHFLRGWAELLYTGANNSTGSIRLRYAKALNYLRLIVGCDVFELKTKDLHISAAKVSELVKKAVEETGAHRQLFRAFQ
jgi:hypothetical protein